MWHEAPNVYVLPRERLSPRNLEAPARLWRAGDPSPTRLPRAHAADDVAGWQANMQRWRNHSAQRLLLSVVARACIELGDWFANDEFELHPWGVGCLPARGGKLMRVLGYDVDV